MSGTEILILVGIVAVFGAFAATVVWADLYTEDVRNSRKS